MNIDKRNSEGYYDPTSFDALTNVAKAEKQSAFRPLVYICSPFSGDTERNSEQARKYSRFAYEQNTIPVTPHLLYPQFMDDENSKERADAMHFNYVLLGKCNELLVSPLAGLMQQTLELPADTLCIIDGLRTNLCLCRHLAFST